MNSTYVIQEHFIGQWSDNWSSKEFLEALVKYDEMRAKSPRRFRLIERTESVLQVDNKLVKQGILDAESRAENICEIN